MAPYSKKLKHDHFHCRLFNQQGFTMENKMLLTAPEAIEYYEGIHDTIGKEWLCSVCKCSNPECLFDVSELN